MIDITADNKAKTQEYGCLLALDEFWDLHKVPTLPAAAATKLDALNYGQLEVLDQAMIATI